LLLTFNCLELTKKCVESVLAQNIPVDLMIIDNGSTDGTVEWISNHSGIGYVFLNNSNTGVSAAWNMGLKYWFDTADAEHVLVLNNDTIIPTWFYRKLLSYPDPFVTGIAVDQMSQIETIPFPCPPVPHPDFSAFLIRKEAWKRIGKFDESMKLYSSDQDYHLRGWFEGVRMSKVNVPYYHERSSTLKHSNPAARLELESQANADRAELRRKWGVSAGGEDYQKLFSAENFGKLK